MRMVSVGSDDSGQRLDRFLQKCFGIKQSVLQKGVRNKNIKVNGKRCECNQRLNTGDEVKLFLPESEFPVGGQKDSKVQGFLNAPAEISVVYEDSNILIVDKPIGLVVHEDDENTQDTLINRVQHYLYSKGEYNPEDRQTFAPALCNRLDRNTCGLVLAAKTGEGLRVLNQKIKDRELSKQYLCLTVGAPKKQEDVAKGYIFKDAKENRVYVSEHSKPGSKTAITSYKVLERRGELSLIEVELITGRTHQIRAHLAYLGAPILGDGKYGIGEVNRRFRVKHQALCAWKLTFKFTTEAGALESLNGRSFQSKSPWFLNIRP